MCLRPPACVFALLYVFLGPPAPLESVYKRRGRGVGVVSVCICLSPDPLFLAQASAEVMWKFLTGKTPRQKNLTGMGFSLRKDAEGGDEIPAPPRGDRVAAGEAAEGHLHVVRLEQGRQDQVPADRGDSGGRHGPELRGRRGQNFY